MNQESDNFTLLEIENLKMHFPVRGGIFGRKIGSVHAVDGVSFKIAQGSTLGLVGESGCGKSTLGKSIVRLYEPTSGKIIFNNQNITKISQGSLRPYRKDFQMVFQDPAESLDARMSVAQLISEPMVIQKLAIEQAAGKEFMSCLIGSVYQKVLLINFLSSFLEVRDKE